MTDSGSRDAPPLISTGGGTTREATDGTAGPDRTLDVRRVEGEPIDRIVEELEGLPEGGTLTLVNSFEPLYAVLEAKGFDHETRRVGRRSGGLAITRA